MHKCVNDARKIAIIDTRRKTFDKDIGGQKDKDDDYNAWGWKVMLISCKCCVRGARLQTNWQLELFATSLPFIFKPAQQRVLVNTCGINDCWGPGPPPPTMIVAHLLTSSFAQNDLWSRQDLPTLQNIVVKGWRNPSNRYPYWVMSTLALL